ncbi:uncharacterized protein LOC134188875 [Corticium candelabrum]|uniref:uncharacterized protein LOC134188875 n=1 Tax=Corticium candelabrum TaxID=121492 RepID=UPI002E258BE1|nr:uncharacterized protein LOC134188875 [Corticium candelabrum]
MFISLQLMIRWTAGEICLELLLGLPILVYLIITSCVFMGFSMSSRSDVGAVDHSTSLRHYLSTGSARRMWQMNQRTLTRYLGQRNIVSHFASTRRH